MKYNTKYKGSYILFVRSDQSLLVDGNFDKDDFGYSSIRFLNAWIVVDLEAAYHIKRIRVMPKQERRDYLYKNVEVSKTRAINTSIDLMKPCAQYSINSQNE